MGVLVGLAYNEDGHEQSGMGASAADYDGDGWLDIVKVTSRATSPILYRNLGNSDSPRSPPRPASRSIPSS